MQALFENEPSESEKSQPASVIASWSTRVLGFAGSVIICWIVLKSLAPVVADVWGAAWINGAWAQIGIAGVLALAMAILLSRIEGTIWGRYYVIIGYLLSLALIVWMVLWLLHYV
jgi:hypothetical protein